VVSGVGLLLRWGPIVLGAVYGFWVAPFLTPAVSHSGIENVIYDLGYPLVSSVIGALVGTAIEAARRQPPNNDPPQGSPPANQPSG
jgi:hypothetical protein